MTNTERDPETRTGLVQTVNGLITPESLGNVMMHEHLYVDGSVSGYYFVEPEKEELREFAYQPVSLENLWLVRYNFKDNLDNLVLDDVEVAIKEVARFTDAGGGTLVDLTTKGIGRDPDVLAMIGQRTGINIVMGTGYYVHASHPIEARIRDRDILDIAEEFIADIINGDSSGIRSGILGEIGCSWPLTAEERKVLQAAAAAQDATGVAINIHPGRNDRALGEIRDILRDAGADLERVIFSHMDRCGYSIGARRDLLDDGCVLEYDVFGLEGYYPARNALMDGVLPNLPNDVGRIQEIKELIELGYGDQIVVSHDIGMKMMLTRYGGWGYGHILRNVVPLMGIYGISEEAIKAMLVRTPQRLLTIV